MRRVAGGAGVIAGGLWLVPALLLWWQRRYFGNGTADVWGHAAGYGWVAAGLAALRSPFRPPIDHPTGQPWSVVDLPVAVLLSPVTAALGMGAAWNLGIVLGIAVGAAGAAAWAHGKVDDRTAVVVGALWGISPFVRGVVASGVAEALILGLLPWLLVALERGDRATPSLLALLLVWIGPYSALDMVIVVGLWAAWARPGWRPLAGVALGAAVGAGLLGWSAWGHPSLHAEAEGPVNPGAMWAWASRGGADLANWCVPGLLLPPAEATVLHRHVAWVGAATGVVAFLVGVRHPRARWMLVAAAVALILSLGPSLRVLGVRTGVPLPGALLGPLLGHNPWRHAGVAALMLPMALACADRRWLALLVFEGLLAPAPLWPASVADPVGPVERIIARGHGAVLDLPLDREGRLPKGPHPQRAFVLGAAHGQPIASALYYEPGTTRIAAIAELDDAYRRALEADPGWRRPRAPGAPPARSIGSFPMFALPDSVEAKETLIRQGFGFVTLAVDAVPPSARPTFERVLTDWLGPPERPAADRWLWRL